MTLCVLMPVSWRSKQELVLTQALTVEQHLHARAYVHTHAHTRTHTHAHTQTLTHAHMHMHAHTRTGVFDNISADTNPQYIQKQQRWLLFLRHCAKCRHSETECPLQQQCRFVYVCLCAKHLMLRTYAFFCRFGKQV